MVRTMEGVILEARTKELTAALVKAEAFISGFEGDEAQDGIDVLLADIRTAIDSCQVERTSHADPMLAACNA